MTHSLQEYKSLVL